MADITWDDVVALEPSLENVPEETQDFILAYVNESLNPGAFGGEDSTKYRLARACLAAHFGELELRNGGGSGAVSSETIGTSSISLAYAAAAATSGSDALLSTSWGAQYQMLVRQSSLRIGGGRTS